jgi:hypothetical protein
MFHIIGKAQSHFPEAACGPDTGGQNTVKFLCGQFLLHAQHGDLGHAGDMTAAVFPETGCGSPQIGAAGIHHTTGDTGTEGGIQTEIGGVHGDVSSAIQSQFHVPDQLADTFRPPDLIRRKPVAADKFCCRHDDPSTVDSYYYLSKKLLFMQYHPGKEGEFIHGGYFAIRGKYGIII